MDTNMVTWWMMAVEQYRQQFEELQRTYLTLKSAGLLDDEEPTRFLWEGLAKIACGVPVVE